MFSSCVKKYFYGHPGPPGPWFRLPMNFDYTKSGAWVFQLNYLPWPQIFYNLTNHHRIEIVPQWWAWTLITWGGRFGLSSTIFQVFILMFYIVDGGGVIDFSIYILFSSGYKSKKTKFIATEVAERSYKPNPLTSVPELMTVLVLLLDDGAEHQSRRPTGLFSIPSSTGLTSRWSVIITSWSAYLVNSIMNQVLPDLDLFSSLYCTSLISPYCHKCKPRFLSIT